MLVVAQNDEAVIRILPELRQALHEYCERLRREVAEEMKRECGERGWIRTIDPCLKRASFNRPVTHFQTDRPALSRRKRGSGASIGILSAVKLAVSFRPPTVDQKNITNFGERNLAYSGL